MSEFLGVGKRRENLNTTVLNLENKIRVYRTSRQMKKESQIKEREQI